MSKEGGSSGQPTELFTHTWDDKIYEICDVLQDSQLFEGEFNTSRLWKQARQQN